MKRRKKEPEMPPKDELWRPFENTVTVLDGEKEVVLEWFGTDDYFWFRPHGAPVEMLWFTPTNITSDPTGRGFKVIHRYGEGAVKSFYSKRDYFRAIRLSTQFKAPDGSWLALQPTKVGLVLSEVRQKANWNTAAFQILPLEFVHNASLLDLEPAVKSAIEADREEWQEVVRWAQMDDEERFWSLVSWERGSPQEWMALMRALLQIAVTGENSPLRGLWPMRIPSRESLLFPEPLRMNQRESRGVANEVSSLAQKHFGAAVDWRYSRRDVEGPFSSWLIAPRVEALPLSQHELMEALALWREFGRGSGQLARVEELLRQLLT